MNSFKTYLKNIGEYGQVVNINGPLIRVEGLPGIKPLEIVYFESGLQGQVFSIDRDTVEIVLFSKDSVSMNEKVVRTNEFIAIPVSDQMLGMTIDPLGNPLFASQSKKIVKTESKRPLEVDILGISQRATIKKSLATGVTVIDLLLPLGMGQKELIIGDRKTGKTSFLLSTIKSQINDDTIVVFAAIARKVSDIKKLVAFFDKEKISDKVVVVATTSNDSPGLIFITPFAAMTIAEFFRDQGRNVLVVFDDLSAHAKFYREMSLIANRFPGRESYPGDIFFIHSRLMERAGNFIYTPGVKSGNTPGVEKEVSITCLPVVETVESDLTSYIATNIMSMTDGHIFFDQSTFARGHRPAVNIPLSVTRVGRQAQSPLKRDINQKVLAFLAEYEKMQNLSHFGAELSGKVQNILNMGAKINALFNQTNHTVIPEAVQLVAFALVWSNSIEENKISQLPHRLIEKMGEAKLKPVHEAVVKAKNLDELILIINQNKPIILDTIGPLEESASFSINQTGQAVNVKLVGGLPKDVITAGVRPSPEDISASLGG